MKRGVWGSGLDTLLLRLRKVIEENGANGFPSAEAEVAMTTLGKSLVFQDAEIEELCELWYGKRRTFPALAMLYPGLNPANSFHEDHIFPKSLFTRKKLQEAGVPEGQINTFIAKVNTLPNLQLLEGLPNEEKQDTLPELWLQGAHFPADEGRAAYLASNDMDGLPLAIDQFLAFHEERRQRMIGRFKRILGTPSQASS
jgi:hypothetical protein